MAALYSVQRSDQNIQLEEKHRLIQIALLTLQIKTVEQAAMPRTKM